MTDPNTWVDRVIVVPDQFVALARTLAAAAAGASWQGMFSCPLSPTGLLPATHWASSGKLWASFADLLTDAEGIETATQGRVPRAAIDAMVQASVVRESDQPFAVLEELGLRIAGEPEPTPAPTEEGAPE